MIILTIRTDSPEAEIGLYKDAKQLTYQIWHAHRQLAETIHQQIANMFQSQRLTVQDADAVVVFQGPGSFTGLRIGISVANALAYGLSIPIIGTQKNWLEDGIERLLNNESDQLAMPEYGAPVMITRPKK